MTGDPTGPTFHLEEHGTAPHRLAILTAAEEDWVTRLAQIYRELRSGLEPRRSLGCDSD